MNLLGAGLCPQGTKCAVSSAGHSAVSSVVRKKPIPQADEGIWNSERVTEDASWEAARPERHSHALHPPEAFCVSLTI